MPILTRYPKRIFVMLVLLALLVGGLVLVLIDRSKFNIPGGALWTAFADRTLNRILLSENTRIEPVTLRTAEGDVSSIWQMVRSRDGSRIAFVGRVHTINHIYVANATGTDAHPVSTWSHDSHPAISPDGSQVVFVRSRSPFSALFITDAETGEERQLTDYTNDLEPDWSPDGTRIVFTTSRDGFQELYTMAPDGSDLQRLTQNENLNDLRATYSPDGSQIAYMTNYAVNDGSAEIWVMDADGRNPRQLTHNTLDDGPPVWSPDGNYLAFSTAITLPPDIQRAIFVYDLRANRVVQLTPSDGLPICRFGRRTASGSPSSRIMPITAEQLIGYAGMVRLPKTCCRMAETSSSGCHERGIAGHTIGRVRLPETNGRMVRRFERSLSGRSATMRIIPKPQPGEYAPYAAMYVDLMPDDGLVLDHLQEQLQRIRDLVRPLSEAELSTPCAEGEWTIKEILVHVIDTERIFIYRALRAARNDPTAMPGFEQDGYVLYSGANALSIEAILNEYAAVRAGTLTLFENLPEAALGRASAANNHLTSVRAATYLAAGHELHHINSIKENYLSDI